MRSGLPGTSTSSAEVVAITPNGVWLLLDDRERFLPFESFPWFRDAPVKDVLVVERPLPHHLYWPELDVDLHVDSIEAPERYPLVAKPQD
ncbi:MAG: DUF2442 domain-containing protein [Bacillota bacterium]|nr:DUF2442 domain-containing protein [Bacillota bacterium]